MKTLDTILDVLFTVSEVLVAIVLLLVPLALFWAVFKSIGLLN